MWFVIGLIIGLLIGWINTKIVFNKMPLQLRTKITEWRNAELAILKIELDYLNEK